MAVLSFEGETEKELEDQVRAWLRSIDERRSKLDPQPFVDQLGRLASTFSKVIQTTADSVSVGGPDVALAVDLLKFGFELGENAQKAVTEGLELIAPGMDSSGVKRRVEEIRDGVLSEIISMVIQDRSADPEG